MSKNKGKKRKWVHLEKDTIRFFSIEAAKKNTTAKPYIENILEKIATHGKKD